MPRTIVETLTSIRRDNGCTLEVSIAESEGRPFVLIQAVSERDDRIIGHVGVRLSEASELARVLDLAAVRPTYVPPLTTRPEPRDPSKPLPPVRASSEPFDECGG